ncbi:V-type proton ATPase subunit a [Cryptosporidium tyzzeri]|nr:V-type proton ATPase subunit a [Cryptosporidium tyzzeri]
MGILRSESMSHGTLVLPNDRAREYIDILGREVNLQFVDMNSITMNRQYKKYIQRIDEMERILRVLFSEIEKLPDVKVLKGNYENFLDHDHVYQLDKVEESLQSLYGQFISFRDNNADLIHQKSSAIEECAVAKAASLSFAPISMYNNDRSNSDFYMTNAVERGEGGMHGGNPTPSSPLMNPGIMDGINNVSGFGDMMFSSIAGVVKHEDQEKFARALFRATRGNTFTHFQSIAENIMDPKTSKDVQKVVFVIYFQGATTSAVYDKISRICDAFNVSIYPWPSNYEHAIQRISELNTLIQDKEKALQAYEQYITLEIETLLQPVNSNNGNSLIEEWRLFCIKEKSIYATLNLFEGSDITLRADCWYPTEEEEKIRKILIAESSTQHVGAFLLTNTSSGGHGVAGIHISEGGSHDDEANISNTPPTYIKTNDFTVAFQDFVNSYGIPRYQEVNPALFTLVSFPFLFGIMYGDVGHGFIVFLIGLVLVLNYGKLKKINDENMKILVSGRYMITMMGFFATYCGLIYNDFFAAGLDIFGSRYTLSHDKLPDGSHVFLPNNNSTSASFPYPFGFDPVWKGAVNEMSFLNSFKMKFSVIIAFFQMTLGVILKGFNNLYFKNYVDFFMEFIPQFIFMVGFIGYLNFLIFFKWLTPIEGYNKPSILNALIGLQSSLFGADIPLNDRFYLSQPVVQKYITLALLISVPWMFFPKPLYLIYKSRKQKKASEEESRIRQQHLSSYSSVSSRFTSFTNSSKKISRSKSNLLSEDDHNLIGHEVEESSGHSDPTEIFIHQLIETVEFLIGSISNTASYLRLWALSLAHNMLALVALQFTIMKALNSKLLIVKVVQLFNLFFMFFAFTSFIMILMDSLECFLHGLRLQWVEFQNKFYKGDGILFAPLNHMRIILETEELLNSS